ncbi:MAG: efflux RND transporter permease subunit [Pseudomonadota bacterium]|nr:efflux RND transporter permease subunit [Pseudomonadota bacterium]
MARFFVDRPVFAWVLALFVFLAGALALTKLPIAQYPSVAPPSVGITATWPGASATILDESVTSLIEQELNGAEGLLYVESSSAANGQAQITATFVTGTNPDLAAVDVQNRLKRVEARLPAAIKQQGVQVTKAAPSFLLILGLKSTDGLRDPIALGDYISRNIINEIRRVPGVGQATFFGSERAMRIWLDPSKMVGLGVTSGDVNAAIQGQNAQVAAGSLGDLPNVSTLQVASGVVVTGQLTTPEAFADIVLRANADGSVVRLGDVARVELGGQSYATSPKLNGQAASMFAVQLSPTGNALATADAVKAKIHELSKYFPDGIEYVVAVDNSKFVRISIEGVVETLIEAVVLVFLVMLLFLQNLRATLIPTIVVPIALLGALATMYAFGFSINVLTMFGLVLAIGIVVDDAIVVVENVERIMAEEGLSPRDATAKAMGQISGAIVGITLVLMAVFVPMAFFGGAVGKIYQQFSLAMVSSIAFSAMLALTLTPALCATMLLPMHLPMQGGAHEKKGLLARFNRAFDTFTHRYTGFVGRVLGRTGRSMAAYGAVVVTLGVLYARLPNSFLPFEDQGSLMSIVTLPPGASANRTQKVLDEMEVWWMAHPAVDRVLTFRGFSFSGSGQNAAMAFVTLKPWDERTAGQDASTVAMDANKRFSAVRDAMVFTVNPPPIRELGTSSGFSFRLQDRGAMGHAELLAARDQLLGLARKSPLLQNVRPEGLEDTPQLELRVDREKAAALGVSFASIGETLATSLGSAYVNDFPSDGRQQRVIVQVDPEQRMQPEDLERLHVRNRDGGMVALSEFTDAHWIVAPVQLVRYNGYPAMRITGEATAGHSTGEAMAEVAALAGQLPAGFGYEWTGTSLEEQTSGAQVPALMALSLLAIFLCLAALYESWSIPAAVLLVVPLGIVGALVATTMRDLPNDVYFKVGLIAVMGLSAKNAILIIEFAKDLEAQGRDLVEATLEAVKMRFRPIVMTSLAFILGVVPLATASGAGSASQRAIGTAVMGGMISATVLAVVLVPVFFVVIRRLFGRKKAPGQGGPDAALDETSREANAHG